jgi:hypothetical protein
VADNKIADITKATTAVGIIKVADLNSQSPTPKQLSTEE